MISPCALPVEPRRQRPRAPIRAAAALRGPEVRIVADIRDISEAGARLITPEGLPVGADLVLKLPFAEPIQARVVWSRDGESGCAFEEPLAWTVYQILRRAFEAG